MGKQAGATALATGVLLLAACSGASGQGSGGSSATDTPAASPTTSSSAPTGSGSSPSGSSSAPSAGTKVDGAALAKEIGSSVHSKGTGHFTLSVNRSRIGTGAFDLRAGRSESTIRAQGRRITTVKVGRTIYLKGLTHGRQPPWVVIRPGEGNPLSKLLTALGGTNGNDPSRDVKVLSRARVVDKGTSSVRGQQVHDYVATVPVSAYTQVLPPKLARTMKRLVNGPARIEYSVGDGQLPVRVTSTLRLSGQRQVTTIDYSDWGKPVHISAPPKSEVTDVAALTQQPA